MTTKRILNIDSFIDEGLGLEVLRNQNHNLKERRQLKTKLSNEDSFKLGEANMLFSDRKFKEAVAIIHKLLEAQPNCPDPYITLGNIYKEMNMNKEAVDCLIIAAKLTQKTTADNRVSLWTSIAELCKASGDNERLLESYSKIVKINFDPEIMLERCALLENMGDIERVISGYKSMLVKHPHHPLAVQELARVYFENKKVDLAVTLLEEAVNAYLEALETNNGEINLDVVNMLCELYVKGSHWLKCTTVLEKVEKCLELPVELIVIFGICKIYLDQKTEALGYFEYLKRKNSIEDYNDLYYDIAEAFLQVEDYDSALSYYEELQKLDKFNNAALWTKIAHCHQMAGRVETAIHYYEEAIESEPGYSNVIFALSELYKNSGMREKAIETINKYVNNTQNEDDDDAHDHNARTKATDIPFLIEKAFILFSMNEYDDFLKICIPILLDSSLTKGVLKKHLKNQSFAVNKKIARYRSSEGTNETSIINYIGLETYLLLLVRVGVVLTFVTNQYSLAIKIIEHHNSFMESQETYSWEEDQILLFDWLLYKASLANNDASRAVDYMRKLVSQNPLNQAFLNECCKLETKINASHVLVPRLLLKFTAEHRDHIGISLTVAASYFNSNLLRLSLYHLFSALKTEPTNELILLTIAAAYFNLTGSRETADRHSTILHSFAFMHKYCIAANHSPNSIYNLARGFHQVGLSYLAVPLYEQVINSDHELKYDAAYNLSHIYQKSGNHLLARKVLMDNIII
jgi:general transcription factor 3C polypeptide 3 (transcription factor C subunit 4)